MFKLVHRGQQARVEVGNYAYFVLSTGKYQTFAKWRQDGRPNPHRNQDYRDDMVTRTQIVDLFFNEA